MAYHYSNPRRAGETHARPNIEVFYMGPDEFNVDDYGTWMNEYLVRDLNERGIDVAIYQDDADPEATEEDWQILHDVKQDLRGWYWWSCTPGCRPDGDAMGPFDSEAEALADARDGLDD